MGWLCMWIEHHIHDDTIRALAMDRLSGLRAACATLTAVVEQRAPMSFEALMYVSTSLWTFTIPLAGLSSVADRKLIFESNVFVPTLSAVLSCSFYLCILALLEAFKEPFNTGIDALNAETILLETETIIVDFLVSPPPQCLASACTEKLF